MSKGTTIINQIAEQAIAIIIELEADNAHMRHQLWQLEDQIEGLMRVITDMRRKGECRCGCIACSRHQGRA